MNTGMIFIDGNQLFCDWKNLENINLTLRIDKFIDLIKARHKDINFIRTYYFSEKSSEGYYVPMNIDSVPYTENKKCTHENKDIKITIEMLKHAYLRNYTYAVLVSRSINLTETITTIKNIGCCVELVALSQFRNQVDELRKASDNFMIISNYNDCV